MVRHFDKVGVLANVLGAVREAGINAGEVQNTVFEGAAAACCAIQLDDLPDAALLERSRARRDEVIFLDCFDLSKGAVEAAAGAPPGRQEAPGAAEGPRRAPLTPANLMVVRGRIELPTWGL